MNLRDVFSKMNEPKRPKLDPTAKPTLIPILADDLCENTPLTDVYVGTIIDPKTTSKVVVQLNSVLPMPELVHLKRVRGKRILLFPKDTVAAGDVLTFLEEKGFDVSSIEDAVEIVSVARIPPKVRRQYEEVHKLWPCNFHSNAHLEKLSTNTLFSDRELEEHAKFMQVAIDVCNISGVKYGAVIVDAAVGSIVGIGFDQSDHYPTKHAVMVAVDNVAKAQKGGVWKHHPLQEKIADFIKDKYGLTFGCNASGEGPYLCTNYSVYVTREPCITCAMALVHSRAKRVFYGAKSGRGALGSLCKIHVVENLNHHYEAFAGLLEEECQSLYLDDYQTT